MAYRWNPNEIHGVTETQMKFMAYHWNPNEIYGVRLKSKSNLWRTTEMQMKRTTDEIYGVPPEISRLISGPRISRLTAAE